MISGLKYIIDLVDGGYNSGIDKAKQKTSELDAAVNKVGLAIAGAFTIGAAKQLIDETTEVATKFQGLDNVIKFASANNDDYAANQQYLSNIVRDMKLPLTETTEGFSGLMGAMKGTVLQGQGTRDIFTGISTASTVLHLSNQNQQSAFMALQQMMSKGKVSAQELTLQLGNAIPGANKLAADAMGLSTAAFAKQMEQGNILAQDFLPKFAAELQKTFGPGLANALDSYQSKMNDANNAIIVQERSIGEKLIPAKLALLNVESQALGLANAVLTFYDKHEDAINSLATGIAVAAGVYVGYNALIKANAIWTGIATTATAVYEAYTIAASYGVTGLAGAQWALNAAMDANPIGIIIGGVALLATGIAYAYNKFDGFRAIMDGTWQTIKDGTKVIIGMGYALVGALTFDPAMIEKGIHYALDNGKKALSGESFKIGVKESIEKNKKDKAEEAATVATTNPKDIFSKQNNSLAATKNPPSGSGGASEGSGGGSSKAGVTIGNITLAKEIHLHAIGGNINERELEVLINRMLTRSVRDFQLNY